MRGPLSFPLKAVSFFYLFLPLLVFVVFWLKLWVAVVLVALFIASLWSNNRQDSSFLLKRDTFSLPVGIGALLVALAWVSISGAGGVGAQTADWGKHNAILKDLTVHSWPVIYSEGTADRLSLVFYTGYYLPAAAIGKCFGWKAANITLYFWTLLGVTITLLWFQKICRIENPLYLALFVILGNLDWIGHFLLTGDMFEGLSGTTHWTGSWISPTNSSDLFWSPHHGLIAWVATSLVMNEAIFEKSSVWLGMIMVASLIWSPFVVMGLIPFGILAILDSNGEGIYSFGNFVFAPLMGLVLVFYFQSNLFQIAHGWLWVILDLTDAWPNLFLYYLSTFGFFILFMSDFGFGSRSGSGWLKAMILCLAAAPLYHFGRSWDFSMRFSLPALYVMRTMIVRSLVTYPGRSRTAILALLVTVATFPAISDVALAFLHKQYRVPALEQTVSIETYGEPELKKQYLGRSTTFFFKQLARS